MAYQFTWIIRGESCGCFGGVKLAMMMSIDKTELEQEPADVNTTSTLNPRRIHITLQAGHIVANSCIGHHIRLQASYPKKEKGNPCLQANIYLVIEDRSHLCSTCC